MTDFLGSTRLDVRGDDGPAPELLRLLEDCGDMGGRRGDMMLETVERGDEFLKASSSNGGGGG